jgi:hypothetical protein
MGFTISIKSSSSPPPRQLSLLPPPSGTNRFHSVDDEMSVGEPGEHSLFKLNSKIPHSFHTQNNIPSSLRDDESYAYHKFLKTTRATD